MSENKIIEFLRKKDYVLLQKIGQGGTGRTVLIKDVIIDEIFVCKKYSPFYDEHKEKYFKYFLDEIKILHNINHKNIVRVFNYYLYPEQTTGYILMEYIQGVTIAQYIHENPDKIGDIFFQIIEGFRYLEENNILHRDIRPENFIISNDRIAKIIDFGFGKIIDFTNNNKSISLNWRYTLPNEFKDEIYDIKTEIYFIGKMFEEIISDIGNIEFKYFEVLSKMILLNPEQRIQSFLDIYRENIDLTSNEFVFSFTDKKAYQNFANNLIPIYSERSNQSEYNNQLDSILRDLDKLYKDSILEEVLQNNDKLTRIFIKGSYKYFRSQKFKVEHLLAFIDLLKSSSENKKKVILNNLWERLDTIRVGAVYDKPIDNDLPF